MQDGKNFLAAIILCLVVLVGWNYLAEYMGWIPKAPEVQTEEAKIEAEKEAATLEEYKEKLKTNEPKLPTATTPDGKTLPEFRPGPGESIQITSPLIRAKMHSSGGFLQSFELQKYRKTVAEDSGLVNLVDTQAANFAPLGLVVNRQPSWSLGHWQYTGAKEIDFASGSQTLEFVGEVDKLTIIREITFNADNYLITERVRVRSKEEGVRSVRLEFTLAVDGQFATGDVYDSMRVAWDNDGKLAEETSADKLANVIRQSGRIYWVGPASTYFIMAAMPANSDQATMRAWIQDNVFKASIEPLEVIVNGDKEAICEVSYWIGPKDRHQLAKINEEIARSVDLGFFSIIGKGLLWLLQLFQSYVTNWGVAIILLTILIKAIFWPLTAKSYSSMEKMRRLKPQMDEIRERCKNDRAAMQKETMALYKTYGVNPASGCVPILLQLPVFFGLYQALLSAIELRHAEFISFLPGTDFLWLADLSAKDPLYITPIVMGASMFIQQLFNPPASDPIQQKIMLALPLIFTVLFLNFPSGLVLYWLVNNILSILQQWLMTRKKRLDS